MQHVSRDGAGEKQMSRRISFEKSLNTAIAKAVDECVNGLHAERNRKLLKRYIIDGVCYEPLAEQFDLSVQQTKSIVAKWRPKIYKYLGL